MHLQHAVHSVVLKAFTVLLSKTSSLRLLTSPQFCFVSPSSKTALGKSFAQPKAQPMDSYQNLLSLMAFVDFLPF